jgi:hypothetical protein
LDSIDSEWAGTWYQWGDWGDIETEPIFRVFSDSAGIASAHTSYRVWDHRK